MQPRLISEHSPYRVNQIHVHDVHRIPVGTYQIVPIMNLGELYLYPRARDVVYVRMPGYQMCVLQRPAMQYSRLARFNS